MPNNESPHATHHTHYLQDDDDGVGGDVGSGDGDGGGDDDIDNNLYDKLLSFMRNLRVREMWRKVKFLLNFVKILFNCNIITCCNP